MSRRQSRLLVGVILAAAVFVASCSSSNDTTATGPTGTHNPSTPKTVTSAPGGGSCSPPGQTSITYGRSDRSDVTSDMSTPRSSMRLLRDVQVTHVDTAGGSFDRVVFVFDAGVPGYSVGYVARAIHADPSDAELTVKGDAVLRVRMEAASGVDMTGSEPRTVYKGRDRLDGPGKIVDEVVRAGDFEAVLTWVIGVERKTGFKAYQFNDNTLAVEVHC